MKVQIQPQPKFSLLTSHAFADVMINNVNNEKSLHITKAFKVNDVIEMFSASEVLCYPTYLTVQVAIDKHITLNPQHLQYINHSCDPNVFFNTETYELIALKNLEPGDELTFFYPSTEWKMTQSFNCFCGSKKCLQNIKGAAFIPKENLDNYTLTSFITKMLQSI